MPAGGMRIDACLSAAGPLRRSPDSASRPSCASLRALEPHAQGRLGRHAGRRLSSNHRARRPHRTFPRETHGDRRVPIFVRGERTRKLAPPAMSERSGAFPDSYLLSSSARREGAPGHDESRFADKLQARKPVLDRDRPPLCDAGSVLLPRRPWLEHAAIRLPDAGLPADLDSVVDASPASRRDFFALLRDASNYARSLAERIEIDFAEPREDHRVLKLSCRWIAGARERQNARPFCNPRANDARGRRAQARSSGGAISGRCAGLSDPSRDIRRSRSGDLAALARAEGRSPRVRGRAPACSSASARARRSATIGLMTS